jgi:5-methylcytosine-specific restriction endonuclease McrA
VTRITTRLCCEPGCAEVLEEALPSARCQAHRRTPWDRWEATADPAKLVGYGHRRRCFRQAIIRERGARCEGCGAIGVQLELHHIDRQGMTGPRAFDRSNVRLTCVPCHRRLGRRKQSSLRQ